MMPAARVACTLLLTSLPICSCSVSSQETRPLAHGNTRAIHLPSAILGDARLVAQPGLLSVAPGGEDELPRGPQGFAVAPDGLLFVADPLADRLVVFDQEGVFQRSLQIGFAADSLRFSDGGLLARKAYSGEEYVVDLRGVSPPERLSQSRSLTGPERAQMLEPGLGLITPNATRGLGQESFEVRLETGDLRLVSLDYLGSDETGSHYVALEAAAAEDTIQVSKRLQKYAPDGRLIAETTDVANDYYISPVDEFRLLGTTVFHLVPLRDAVTIQVWETDGLQETD